MMTRALAYIEKTKTSPLGAALLGLLSIAALAASAKIQVPMIPVPVTLQTAVVLLLPCLLGTRLSLAVLAGYFAAGAMGLPVFAGAGLAGPAYFVGPTGGYLIGFVAAAAFVGSMAASRPIWSFAALTALMLAGHAVILAFGTAWLAYGLPALGWQAAFAAGTVPFLAGSALKSALVAASVKALQK